MTREQRKAIKRICADFGFDDYKELKEYFKDFFGDPLDLDLWDKTEDGLYNELTNAAIIFAMLFCTLSTIIITLSNFSDKGDYYGKI